MTDLVVIGAGYWGAAIAHEARQRGRTVVVFDDQDPHGGSRNASGICHPKTYSSSLFRQFWPERWTREDLMSSFDWLKKHAGAKETQEHFFNHTRADLGIRPLPVGLYLEDNEALTSLAGPVRAERVEEMSPSPDGWKVNGVPARRVAIAAGIHSDNLLTLAGCKPIGVGALWGRGMIVSGENPRVSPLVVQTRPYRKFETRPWGTGLTRIGDTAEKRRDDEKYRRELRDLASWVVPGYDEVGWLEGYRPVARQFTVEVVAPSLLVATGGHRMGLGIAGLVACEANNLLEL